jgi:hypothetical protein
MIFRFMPSALLPIPIFAQKMIELENSPIMLLILVEDMD